MAEEYARNVAKNGLACTANTCGNEAFKSTINHAVQQMTREQQDSTLRKDFQRAEMQSTKAPKPSAATPATEPKNAHNDLPNSLNGYRVTYVKATRFLASSRQFAQEHFLSFILLWTLSVGLGVIIGIVRRKWIRNSVLQLMPR